MPFRAVSTDIITPLTTTGLQADPSNARLTNGNVVIVWDSASGDSNGDAVMGRLFNPVTNVMGREFRLNTTLENTQADPVVTALSNGRFVAAWVSMDTGDGSGYCIRARVFEADGTAVGNDFIVNSSTPDNQVEPSITALADGRFAIAFSATGGGGDGDSDTVRVRLFDGNGAALGADTIPITTIAGPQGQPALATLSDGRMVMIYGSAPVESPTADFDVRGVLMDANGNRIGADFAVATTTTEAQGFSNVISLSNGGFFASWYSNDFDGGSGSSVRGRFFDANATPLGNDFLLNSTRTGDQIGPSAAQLDDGRIVVVWWSTDTGDRSGSCIRARVFDQNGVPEAADFIVNSTTFSSQGWPTVTALPGSRFTVSWTSADTGDGSQGTVRTRVFDPIGVTLNGTGGNDVLTGTAYSDSITGGSGDDTINGQGGSDSLSGGIGNDTVDGGDGDDYVNGDSGNDRLVGGAGTDFLTGGTGSDVFVPSSGIDRVSDFEAGVGLDRIDVSGLGIVNVRQVLNFASALNATAVQLAFDNGRSFHVTGLTPSTLESRHFIFATGPGNDILGAVGQNDVLTGTTASETILGYSGNDTIDGRGGGDFIDAGEGDDILYYYYGEAQGSIVGGAGDDTLVIIEEAAPNLYTVLRPQLDLAARSIEFVRFVDYDEANTASWWRTVSILDQNLLTLSSETIADDGSKVVITFDQTGQAWTTVEQLYNTQSQRTTQQTRNDDGSRNAYYWDSPGAQTWRELSEDYNSAGERTLQRIYNDDNSYRFFYWDPTGNQNWGNFDEEYNASGARHTQRIVYDGGDTRNFYWDTDNAQSWTTFDEQYAPNGMRFVQRIQNDDGTSSQQFWDSGSMFNHSTYVDYMDATGARTEQRIFFDEGVNAGGYSRTFFDVANSQSWSSIAETYNAAGVRLSQIITPD